jgi:hypothetical protein
MKLRTKERQQNRKNNDRIERTTNEKWIKIKEPLKLGGSFM